MAAAINVLLLLLGFVGAVTAFAGDTIAKGPGSVHAMTVRLDSPKTQVATIEPSVIDAMYKLTERIPRESDLRSSH